MQAVVQRQQHLLPERHCCRFLQGRHRRRMWAARPHWGVLDRFAVTPFSDRLGVEVITPAQRRDRILRSLYLCSDGVRCRGAFVKNLSHGSSSDRGSYHSPVLCETKHLGAPTRAPLSFPSFLCSGMLATHGRSAFRRSIFMRLRSPLEGSGFGLRRARRENGGKAIPECCVQVFLDCHQAYFDRHLLKLATPSHEEATMSDTFTKGMARNIYFGGSVFFFLVFLGLTYHTEQTFPERTNASELTEAVVRGKEVWENNNCIGCHS